jgi:hypothetical protein
LLSLCPQLSELHLVCPRMMSRNVNSLPLRLPPQSNWRTWKASISPHEVSVHSHGSLCSCL